MKYKLILFILFNTLNAAKFDKVVIWGHKLYSHTSSFIHYGFFKAFTYLGYKTYWLDNSDDISKLDLSNALFITEGQVDQRMPHIPDGTYLLHNCDMQKYKDLAPNQALIFQVYTNDCENRGCKKLAPYILYNLNSDPGIIYMPWPTDLLPYEINEVKNEISKHGIKRDGEVVFVGTIWDGLYGNIDKLNKFHAAVKRNSIQFNSFSSVTIEESIKLVRNSYMAPAIQGEWQCDVGYIPCRIFKNISNGKLGITNNKTVYELFDRRIVYNADCYELFLEAHQKMQSLQIDELFEMMDFVRDNHTYLNRIDALLRVLEFIKGKAAE